MQLFKHLHHTSLGLACLALEVLSAPTMAGTLVVDDNGGPGTFPSIQSALAAAAPGDLILINPGNYTGTVVNKPVTILGNGPAFVLGSLVVSNLPAGSPCTLSGLALTGLASVQSCQGPVFLDNLSVTSLVVDNSADVRVQRISTNQFGGLNTISNSWVELSNCLLGGKSGNSVNCGPAGPGTAGLGVFGAAWVHLAGTTLTGGNGGSVFGCASFSGGAGGPGLAIEGGSTVLVTSEPSVILRGGDGGSGTSCATTGSAGAGVRLDGGHLQSSNALYLSGQSCAFTPPPIDIQNGSLFQPSPADPYLSWSGFGVAGGNIDLTLVGPPSTPGLLFFGSSPLQLPFGTGLVGIQTSADLLVLAGTTDSTFGRLDFQLIAPPLLPLGSLFPTQGLLIYPNLELRLTNSIGLFING